MIKYSKHALEKISIYGFSILQIDESLENIINEYYDVIEDSIIKIIRVEEAYLSVVINDITNQIITIYKTDLNKIQNRKEAGRWI